MSEFYSKGQVLKSALRTDSFPLFVMVCDDCTLVGNLDQTDCQFRAIVLFDNTHEWEPGMVDNTWNKGRWLKSDLLQVAKVIKIADGNYEAKL